MVEEINLIEKFKKEMSKNIMTPNVIGYTLSGKTIVELSEGTGIENEPIFGVTVRTLKDDKWVDEKAQSQMFHSKEKAKRYINEVVFGFERVK